MLLGPRQPASAVGRATTDEFGGGAQPANHLGWLGDKERFTVGGALDLVQMGVRLYSPPLGRFLEVEPVEGGSANDYDYVYQDPVNHFDLDGRFLGAFGNWVADRYHDAQHLAKKGRHAVKRAAGWVSDTWKHHNPFRSWYKFGQFSLGIGLGLVATGAGALGIHAGIGSFEMAPETYGLPLFGLFPAMGLLFTSYHLYRASGSAFGRAFASD